MTPDPPRDAFEDWTLVLDGTAFSLGDPDGADNIVDDMWDGGSNDMGHVWRWSSGSSWTAGQEVSVQLVQRRHLDWEVLRDETDGDTSTSFTDSENAGDKRYVYRVWAYNEWGRSLYSWRGNWLFTGP